MKQCVEAIISWLIKCNAINSEDKELYNYALYSMFLSLSPIILALFWGICFKCPLKSVLIVFPFILIRKYSGGYHTKNLWSCLVWSTVLLLLCILVCIYLNVKEIYWPIVLLASASLVCLSPIDNENRRLTEDERYTYKKQTIAIVTSFLLILLFLYIKQLFTYFICISIGVTLSACLQIPSIIGVNNNRIMKKKTKIEIIYIGIIIMWIVRHNSMLVYAEKYEYDALNRVTKVIYEDGSTVEYAYDKNGNILSTVIHENKSNNEDNNGGQENSQNEESEDDGSGSSASDSGGTGNGSSPGSGSSGDEAGSTGSDGSGSLSGTSEAQKESGSPGGSQSTGVGQNAGAVSGIGESGASEENGTPGTGNVSGNGDISENGIASENGNPGETSESEDQQTSTNDTAGDTDTGDPDAQGWLHRLFVSVGRAFLKIVDFFKSLFS